MALPKAVEDGIALTVKGKEMNKARDEAGERHHEQWLNNPPLSSTVRDDFKAGWDECMRSEPRVLALLNALEVISNQISVQYAGFVAPSGIARQALTAFTAFKDGMKGDTDEKNNG